MRKKYLMLMSFALMSMMVNAQSNNVRINKTSQAKTIFVSSDTKQADVKTARIGARATGLKNNQRYINYSYDESLIWPVGFNGAKGAVSLGTLFSSDSFKKFEGCKIVGARFYLTGPKGIGATKVSVCPITKDGDVTSAIVEKEASTTVSGWNTVWFDNPYTINTDEFSALMPFYYYYPSEVESVYPIGASGTYVQGGFIAYGDIYENETDESNWQWEYIMANGNLMLQLIIENPNGDFILHDLVMDNIATVPFAKPGDEKALAFTCHNEGRDDITNADFNVSIDGKKYASFNYKETNITDADYTNVPIKLPIPENLTIGEHEITVSVDKVEGDAPAGDLTNDQLTTKIKVYKDSYDRQKSLVEEFACQSSLYSYFGDAVLSQLDSKRNEDNLTSDNSDLAIVALHGETVDGDQTLTDEFALPEAAKIATYSTSAPASASFNRYYYKNETINEEEELAVNIAAQNTTDNPNVVTTVIGVLSGIVDEFNTLYPSFTTVGIDTKVDDNSGKLNIKVMGKLANNYEMMIGKDARLTVYLTQDKVTAKQAIGTSSWRPRYSHNHVLRKIVTNNLGDALQLKANGNIYCNEYNVDLDDSWKTADMHVIAFISRPMTEKEEDGKTALASALNDVWVDNTNIVEVGESDVEDEVVTSISPVFDKEELSKEVARYTIDGQKINHPVKGINLIKLSNGKTIKVMVK